MLDRAVAAALSVPVRPEIAEAAGWLCRTLDGDAVLFYGSMLRAGDLDGIADFYVLRRSPSRGWSKWLWPDVSYHELPVAGGIVRAKVAVMSLDQFERAAQGRRVDTTVWTRFAQPVRLPVAPDPAIADRVRHAVADCIVTACRFAAALGPAAGSPDAYWQALFDATYGAELRVERRSRAASILAADPDHYRTMLPLAWQRLGISIDTAPPTLAPGLTAATRRRWQRQWRVRRWAGKPLNVARLIKASFTFEGAGRYALWKIERHTGVAIPVTPWREKHPVLAAPAVLFRLWRSARA